MDFDFNTDIVLENDRVLMRPLVSSDFGLLLQEAIADSDLLRFSPIPIHSSDLLRSYIEMMLKDRLNNTRYPFIIFDKMQGSYAGNTSFLNISDKDKRLEIGSTWIGRKFHHSGLNTNCKFLLLQYAFDHLGFDRVELKTDERNLRSRAAIEKIGGRFEGILRSHTVMSDGFRRNTVYYSILRDEWPEVRQKLKNIIGS